MLRQPPTRNEACNAGEQGFLLVAMILAVALVLIFLAVAAPRVAKDMQRDREVEMMHRGNQYVRAIRLYYRKNKHYPASMDELVQSNNIRFLRQKYIDPMTDKNDWRIIPVGANKTQVTGFFGKPLEGLAAGGLGSAAGMASTTATSTPSSPFSALWGGPSGTSGSTGSNGSTGASGSSGSTSTDATAFNGSGPGPFMGVSSQSPKTSIISFRGQTTYNTWEFIYDPRIETLYAKASLLGGVNSSSGSGSSSFGQTGSSGSTGTGTTTTNPTSTPPSDTTTPKNCPGNGTSYFDSNKCN